MQALEDYLYFNRIMRKDFAVLIECSAAHLSQYIKGKTRMSRKIAEKIEIHTKGLIKADDIMKNNPAKKYLICPHCKEFLNKKPPSLT